MAAQSRTNVDRGSVQIEILHQGDAEGNGLVRHCHLPVPKYLFTGGVAQSWEWITEASRPVSWRYDDRPIEAALVHALNQQRAGHVNPA